MIPGFNLSDTRVQPWAAGLAPVPDTEQVQQISPSAPLVALPMLCSDARTGLDQGPFMSSGCLARSCFLVNRQLVPCRLQPVNILAEAVVYSHDGD